MGEIWDSISTFLSGGMVAFDWMWSLVTSFIGSDVNVVFADANVTAIINKSYSAVAAAGITIAFCITLYGLLQQSLDLQRELTLKQVVGPFLKFAFVAFAISNGLRILEGVVGIANKFISDIGIDSLNQVTLSVSQVLEGFLAKVLLVIPIAMFGLVGSLGATAVVFYNLIVTFIEVILRAIFMPVAMANLCGQHSPRAVGYLKKMLGCSLYFGAYLIVIPICASVCGALSINGIGSTPFLSWCLVTIICGVGGPFTVIGAASTAKAFINEALE